MVQKNESNKRRQLAPKKKANPHLIYGIRAVMEAIRSGKEFEKLFIQKTLQGELVKELYAELTGKSIPTSKVPVEKLNRFTGKNHQGVVGFISPVRYHPLENLVASVFEKGEDPFFIVLDRITDVRNFGAIARSAESAGAHGILIPVRNAAQINSDAIKTSAGALTSIPVSRVERLAQGVDYLKESGCRIVCCTEKGRKSIYEQDFSGPVALIMGSEEDGITPEVFDRADLITQIPLQGRISSLNVSAATAICAFEIVRQRLQVE